MRGKFDGDGPQAKPVVQSRERVPERDRLGSFPREVPEPTFRIAAIEWKFNFARKNLHALGGGAFLITLECAQHGT